MPALAPVDLIDRYLDVIEHDLLPLTMAGVSGGNKIFGAAVLAKDDRRLIVAAVNAETENPLWHGEIATINAFYALPPGRRPSSKDCLFLATHEPCSLCLSGITWSGFDNFGYLFDYQDTRDAFGIPHDIRILREVYAVPDPDRTAAAPDRPLYNRSNAFFSSAGLRESVAISTEPDRSRLSTRINELATRYRAASEIYRASRGGKGIPLD